MSRCTCPLSQKSFLCVLKPHLHSCVPDGAVGVFLLLCDKNVTSFPPFPVRWTLEGSLQSPGHKAPAVRHTHHLICSGICSGNGSALLFKQVTSPFHTTHIHPQYIQFLEHFSVCVSVPTLSCFIREVWQYQFNHYWNAEEGNRLSFIKKATIRAWHASGADKATWHSYFTLASLSNYSFFWILECD